MHFVVKNFERGNMLQYFWDMIWLNLTQVPACLMIKFPPMSSSIISFLKDPDK